jgi:cytoskeletal protein RodZ
MNIKKNKNHTKNNRTSRSKKGDFIILIMIFAVFILGGFFISSHNNSKTINQTYNRTVVTKISSASDTPAKTTTGANSSDMAQRKQSSPGSTSTINSGAAPITPSGTFVSGHLANLDSNELSICNTSSGAICSITFTNSSGQKSLTAKQTDSNGAAYWSWTPSSLGLSSGSWQVAASAIINGKSVSTQDPKTLEVQ